jgi:hypothetical protein
MERGFSRQQNTKELFTQSTIVAFVSTSAYLDIKKQISGEIDVTSQEKMHLILNLQLGYPFSSII